MSRRACTSVTPPLYAMRDMMRLSSPTYYIFMVLSDICHEAAKTGHVFRDHFDYKEEGRITYDTKYILRRFGDSRTSCWRTPTLLLLRENRLLPSVKILYSNTSCKIMPPPPSPEENKISPGHHQNIEFAPANRIFYFFSPLYRSCVSSRPREIFFSSHGLAAPRAVRRKHPRRLFPGSIGVVVEMV